MPLAAWAGVLILRPDLPATKRAILIFIGTGLVLTLTVEVIVLVGDIGRMNTVFKFYLQVWTLFAISAAAAFGWLFSALQRWSLPWRAPWQVILVVLVGCTALYPILASVAKINHPIAPQAPHSLDGLVYMPYATYNESGTEMDLGQDYDAIRWKQENIKGSPVVVEANSPNLYRWYNRYTINTGLPGVLGWEWHQQQQRALNPSTWVHERLTEIQYFYTTLDSGFVRDFIQKYSVRYIVVGQLEHITFPGPGLEKLLAETKNLLLLTRKAGLDPTRDAMLPVRHSVIAIWIVPLSVFDDPAWTGAEDTMTTEQRRTARRATAGEWLASEGIGLVVVPDS